MPVILQDIHDEELLVKTVSDMFMERLKNDRDYALFIHKIIKQHHNIQ